MNKINTLQYNHKLFQQRLLQLADPPERLYYLGDNMALKRAAIAIVGSRKPTPYGQEVTYRLAYDLASRGVVIVSGLAIGVDGIAHQAALDAGGQTVAVLAGGLDDIYPKRHQKLASNIVANGGVLLSEYPPGMPCLQHQFIARNRIVAALADGVLITEAASKSGSLHTADFALDLGRTVMAVPGLVTNPMASGCLKLLQNGAELITSAQDVIQALGLSDAAPQSNLQANAQTSLLPSSNTAAETKILELLTKGIRASEDLYLMSKLSMEVFTQTLTMLEIAGKIKPSGANQWIDAADPNLAKEVRAHLRSPPLQ